ncbi:transglycosylase family protein [Kitasatospora sp. NPDC057015]|uniref:transglycosylase family protein n=1 Tax=Kitasatospora sp. NPDC057015 TaxID=3346001 RepID=UPI003645E7AF
MWDELAQCESSGDWAADTGNGYYGGLQIWPPTWAETGGPNFADRPDHATRREQIFVAEEILRRQGWEAWPHCSLAIGAQHIPPSPRPEPGAGPSPDPDPDPGPESPPESGSETDPGWGPEPGFEADPEPDPGAGPETWSGSWPDADRHRPASGPGG